MDAHVTLRDLENGRIGPYLQSKKNRVFRASVGGKEYVVKVFRGEWKERAQTEFDVLSECREKNVPAPHPVGIIEDAVVMEPLVGDSAVRVFDRLLTISSSPDLSEKQRGLADSLAEWLSKFHTAFAFELARGDTILKNFIMTFSGPAGLDFEEASRTDTLSDLGQLCASAVMTDPPFTDAKMAFTRRMAGRYWECCGRDRSGELDNAVSAAIRHYAPFRANGSELLQYASELEKGLLRIG